MTRGTGRENSMLNEFQSDSRQSAEIMVLSCLNQMKVVFGKKLESRDVTRQCQGRVSQKRVWVFFGRAQCSRTRGSGVRDPPPAHFGGAAPLWAAEGAWPCEATTGLCVSPPLCRALKHPKAVGNGQAAGQLRR